MRLSRIAIITAACGALALGGCASNPPPTPSAPLPSTGNAQIDQVVSQAQQIAINICKFKPTADTVAGIFFSGNPIYQTASGIASAICAAVNPSTAKMGARRGGPLAAPTVAGVRIEGQFVR